MTPDEYKRRKRAQRYQANREKEIARSRAYQAAHAAELREKRMARYRALKAQGICVLCGKAPAAEGKANCAACLAYKIEYQRRSEARRNGHGKSDDTA